MGDKINLTDPPPPEEEEKFELSPEEATGLGGGKPAVINRRRILILICVFFSVFVCGGLLINAFKQNNKKTVSENSLYASNSSSSDFLDSLQNRAINNRRDSAAENKPQQPQTSDKEEPEKEPLLPQASLNPRPADPVRQPPPESRQQPPAPQSQQASQGPAQNGPPPTHFKSPLTPVVEGRLFSQQGQYSQPAAASRVSNNAAQNGARDNAPFYDPSGAADAGSGFYIGENSIWAGTVIPGVLETAVNTDLPGEVMARVTQNIFDSKTGRNVLIPQGTLLLARYNSSISYAQRRVQIVWDTMIRPDGFQIDLGGSNGVDREGMSGQSAVYHENWFEYLKAAGIITLFSVANAKMAETSAKFASDAAASNIVESNSAFVNQVGGNVVGRAMNIQPTLTVDNGTPVNIMLNKTLYLPPITPYPASQKYKLE